MSTINDGLAFYFKLDSLGSFSGSLDSSYRALIKTYGMYFDNSTPVILDDSNRDLVGLVSGGVTPIPDDTFGSCLHFDGETGFIFIPVPGKLTSNSYTFSIWINASENKSSEQCILGKFRDFDCFLNGNTVISQRIYKARGETTALPDSWKANQWNHVAVTCGGKGKRLFLAIYINGIEAVEESTRGLFYEAWLFILGRTSDPSPPELYFEGKLANFRFYDRALSIEEVNQVMEAEQKTSVSSNSETQPGVEANSNSSGTQPGTQPSVGANSNSSGTQPGVEAEELSLQPLYPDLVLHLKLDDIDIKKQKVFDSSGLKKDGNIREGVSLVPDDRFGACLQFDGQKGYIEVPDSEALRINNYTVTAWINPDPIDKDWQGIVGKPGRNFNIWLNQQAFIHHRFHISGNTSAGAPNTPDGSIKVNQWNHVAITNDGQNAITYINGIEAAKGQSGALIVDNQPLYIGRNLDGSSANFFKGKLANVRIYKQALSVAEIQQVIDADKLSLPAYRAGHPIAFNLFDDNNNSVLYISDEPKQEHILQLELTNTSSQAIQFLYEKDKDNQPIQKASATNHHFELLFRPNTLSRATIAAFKAALNVPIPDKTKILKETSVWDIALSDDVTGDGLNQFVSLYLLYQGGNFEQSEKHILTLQKMTAEARTGTRGTQVELKLNNLAYVGAPSPTTGVPVQITGSRVQNLHITNHSGRKTIPLHVGFVGSNRILNDGVSHPLKLRITNTSKEYLSPPGTNFTFSFDVGAVDAANKDWAIATDGNKISVEVGGAQGKTDTVDTGRGTGISQGWQIKKSALPSKLAPNEHIEITFHITTNHPSGHTNLYIDYSVPGYWDGQFVCVIEKAPLLFAKNKVGVGIGVSSENITNTLEVKGGGTFTDGGLILKATADDPGNIIFQDSANRQKGRIWTNTTSGNSGLYLSSGDNTADISIDKDGKVGIGAPSPNYKLDINGDTNVSGTIYRGGNPLAYENYEIYLRGSAYDSPEGNDTFLKIANVSISMTNNTGLNTVILGPDGRYKKQVSHNVFNDARGNWNVWADWINNSNNVANGDVVAVASFDAISSAPRGGSAETLLTSINALMAFDVETRGDYPPRSPYALLFIKGRVGAMEVCQIHKGPNAHIKTTYYELFNCSNSSVVLRGMIMMWSGKANQIPSGWALCNGQNGTPDLRNCFIMGTDANTALNDASRKGGSRSHSHQTNRAGSHAHGFYYVGGTSSLSLTVGGGQTAMQDGGEHEHSTTSADHLPPYFALAFIMKT